MTDFTCTETTHRSNGHPLVDLSNKLTTRINALRQRRKLGALVELEDHRLKDIGLTRGAIRRTLAQPLSVDATTELHRIAYLRAARRM